MSALRPSERALVVDALDALGTLAALIPNPIGQAVASAGVAIALKALDAADPVGAVGSAQAAIQAAVDAASQAFVAEQIVAGADK